METETTGAILRQYLTATEIGKIWGEERAKALGKDPQHAAPISVRTVWAYVWHSTHPRGRYFGVEPQMPMPEYPNPDLPHAGQHAQWWPKTTKRMLEEELRNWWNNRPTAGTGRRAGGPSHSPEVISLVRARARVGTTDRAIAEELATKYNKTPTGRPYTVKVVEGIRNRNDIPAGAWHRRQDKETSS